MEVRLATKADINDVLALMHKYHIDGISEEDKPDGFVTTRMSHEQMQALVEKEQGITIARQGDALLAFAMAGSWGFWSEWPFFENMIRILPEYELDGQPLSVDSSYQYGPICIDKSVRGSGVFESVFSYSLASMKERFPVMVTFINRINNRSYAAHTRKAGMSSLGTFDFNGNSYYMLACPSEM